MRHSRIALSLLAAACAGAVLSGCATNAGSTGAGTIAPAPGGEVVGTGTVIDASGDVRLCFAVAESYPPQCGGGVALRGWEWDGVEGSETASGVTWGSYAVQGTYDGEALTLTRPPILLALYDPAPREPLDQTPGTTDEATLLDIQEELNEELGADFVSSYPADGFVALAVVADDGSLQAELDERYGPGVVRVESLLQPIAD